MKTSKDGVYAGGDVVTGAATITVPVSIVKLDPSLAIGLLLPDASGSPNSIYLTHPTPVKVTDTVCVIGAGNVAMDAARTAKRLGAKNVYIVYRRGPEEVPARAEEVHHAKEEGIIFKLLTNPVKIEGEDGWVNLWNVFQL